MLFATMLFRTPKRLLQIRVPCRMTFENEITISLPNETTLAARALSISKRRMSSQLPSQNNDNVVDPREDYKYCVDLVRDRDREAYCKYFSQLALFRLSCHVTCSERIAHSGYHQTYESKIVSLAMMCTSHDV